MLRPVLTSAPTAVLVSLSDAKAHCRVDDSADVEDDAVLEALVKSATQHLDGFTGILGRCLATQQWQVDIADWPYGARELEGASDHCFADICLPFPDVSTVEVKYFDADNVEQTVLTSAYAILEDMGGAFIRFNSSFDHPAVYADRADAVQITLTAGYGDETKVPDDIKLAIKMMVSHWFDNRESVVVGTGAVEVPMSAQALLEPYRIIRI